MYKRQGLRAGCDVFCEKPVAVKYTDAEMVFAEAEKLGKHLFVTQSLRFFKDYVAAADIVKSGALGNMYSVSYTHLYLDLPFFTRLPLCCFPTY